MAYDPQQQRPEDQQNNGNRETLNIRQPGESGSSGFDWEQVRAAREAYGRKTVQKDPGVTLGDIGKAIVTVPLDMINAGSEMFRAGNQAIDQKVSEAAADNPNPLGLSNEMVQVMRDNAGNPLSSVGNAVIGKVGELAGGASKVIKDTYSDGAKEAAAMPFVERDKDGNLKAGAGLFDKDAWFMNAVPPVAQIITGGALSKLGASAAREMAEHSVFNRLSKTMPEEAARQIAKETADRAAAVAGKTTFVSAMAGTAQGSGGIDMREQINGLSFNELMQSPTFQTAFNGIDADPNNVALSDSQKLALARNQVADQAASAVTGDPRLLAINIAASTLGDHTLLKLLTSKGTASGVLSGMATGAAVEGATEFAQGAGQRYAQNQQLIDTVGQNIDPMKDVIEIGANNAVVGAGMGGAIGAVGGARGRSGQQQETPQSSDANQPTDGQQLVGGEVPEPATSDSLAGNGTVAGVAEPAGEQFAPENVAGTPQSRIDEFRDTPAYLRQDPRIQGFAEDNEVQQALAEQQPAPTADELIRQQIDQGDQGYTPEELAALERAEQIIAARHPRLPSPGQTFVIAMPGEVRQVVDEVQAGDGPQFDAGEQVRGQQYIPAERAAAGGNEVGRAARTIEGETVPTNAIEDKNIIFAGAPTIDEGQTAQPPQFSQGEARAQRQTREFTEAMGADSEAPAGLPDNRHRIGGVPVDGQTEAYARGEPVGQLKLFAGNKPYSSERVARATQWAKVPGATIEPVGDGYGVRLPPEPTEGSRNAETTNVRNEQSALPQVPAQQGTDNPEAVQPDEGGDPVQRTGMASVAGQPAAGGRTDVLPVGAAADGDASLTGELKLYAPGQPYSNERVAKASRWAKMPGATVEPVGNGYGVRLPATDTVATGKRGPKLTDFGEEIKGAAKHRWGQFSSAMERSDTDDDIKAQPLSKIFPHPEYEKMAEDGVDNHTLAALAVLRGQIPNKPSSPYKVGGWGRTVKTIKGMANDLLSGNISRETFRQHMQSRPALSRTLSSIDLVSKFPPSEMREASRYRVDHGRFTKFEGKDYPDGKEFYTLVRPDGRSSGITADSMDKFLPKAQTYIKMAIGAKGEAGGKQSKIETFVRRADGQIFLGYKGGAGVLPLKSGFKNAGEARAYLQNNRPELEEKLEKLRKISREEQRNPENRKRVGPSPRKGDISPEQFTEKFGFRGVQFGNYVEGARRQTDLNEAYDALSDLADVVNVPAQALSLNGELGLAFGARGKGGKGAAKAHYEPDEVVINITKAKGSGTLAHEWFHALDNYFGQANRNGHDNAGRGDAYQTRDRFLHGNVRIEVREAFRDVMKAVGDSGMTKRASVLDEARSKAYWSTDIEMAARAFEAYAKDKAASKGITNDYLVNIRDPEASDPDTHAYPTKAEMDGGIRQAFDNLFKTLKTRETDKGVAFYSRESDNIGVRGAGTDIGGGNIIHDGSFSRDGSKPAQGMTRDRVQLASDLFVSNLNGAAKIKVKAVQTQAEAAAMMPNGIPAEFGTVHAIYQPELSRVILIADNIANPCELRAKLRHEIIAHHGLASVIGDVEYDRIMRVLHQTRDSKNKTIQDVWRQVEQSYGQESLETQANEFLAHMAERTELTGLGAVWDRFVSMLTAALRRSGIINAGINVTPTEIRSILRTITGRFQKTAMYANEQPGTRAYEDTFSRADALYSQSNDNVDPLKPLTAEAEQYRADLDKAMRSLKSGDMSIKIGRTPPVLRALGAPNLNMVISRDTVRKATNGVKHDVPMDVIERLPELMHDPVAVYRSATQDNAVVVLLEASDANGNPVVSAVHMNATLKRIDVNRIASVYGTVGGMVKIQGMEDAGLALYRREKENPDNPHSQGLRLPKEERSYQGSEPSSGTTQGLQLPQRGSPDVGSDKNILSSDDIRKNKALYSRSGNPTMDAETSRKMGFNVEKGWFDKAKDFYQIATDKDKTELKQWWSETFRKLNTKTFDGLAPLKYAEDAAGKSDATVSGYTAARMSAGSGSVTAAVLEHGLVRYNKAEGITERIPGTGKADSLMGILDGLGNHRENFLKWIAGHRSERLMAEGRENNFTADEIAYMKTLNQGNEKLFADQKKKYDAFIKSILDFQQDTGLIDPESRATWEDAWYLPYFREAENGETHGPWTTRGIANQSSTVRKLKGSELTIKDPIENLFNYVAKSVDASMKNEAMRRSVVNLVDTGMLEVIESPNKMDYQRIGKNVVKVYVDGLEQLVQVNDPDLYLAFTMIDLERSNSVFMRAARQAKRVLTIGTTSMPDFIIRNFMRDSLHSWAINKDGFKAVRSSWEGLRKAMKTDDTLVDMMFAGATFGGGYVNVYDPAGTAANIRRVLRRKGYNDSQIREFESTIVRSSKEVLGKLETGWDKYRKVSEGAENANRVATYDAAIKAGKSRAQAAFEARDLMDFSMMGASKVIIGLTDVVPFLNARLQGMSKLGRAIAEDPREVLKRGGYIAGLSLSLLAMNWDDERYEELPDWDKNAYWHAWLPGGQHIRFPKPFEIGLMFGTLPERFVRTLGGEETPGKFGKVMARNFAETMAFNPIPQVVKPIAEAYVNYDFFRGGPIENMADQNLLAEARYNDQTSLMMRAIGEATGMSPKMLDHVVQGYTGTLGAYVLGATNIMARQFGDNGETPALRLDELPVIKSFLRGSDPAKSTQFADDFYQMMTKANQINSTINAYRKRGQVDDANELLEENRSILAQRKKLTNTQKVVRQLNDRIEMVRIDRTLSADEKRVRIDHMMAQRNKLYSQAVERVNPYFE
ncbi:MULTISPECIES: LPD38 domain-containing protein [unclassified Brenneria]|uniref:LPD38 domain-containing protein n=1 Tax=unclassified Brenneria TaxID=2634434 RepID=UPI001553453F|nr:LPD38 domain-containing protein [Brenneria sp. hezel4-2-4]MEE3649444.1 LPD38 domain-containing protein [Brenneria sp. HEZEL_4_2_4]NPC99400.1 hypothetical protein [Brenneria sp. hezel4-2-4]